MNGLVVTCILAILKVNCAYSDVDLIAEETNYYVNRTLQDNGDEFDLDIRFNKIPSYSNSVSQLLPLTSIDYPLCIYAGRHLQRYSGGVSVVLHDDYELRGETANEYIEAIGGLPTMPNSNSNHAFWEEMRHVVKVQIDRRNSLPADPNDLFRLPGLWSSYNIHDVATAVHDEYPGYHQHDLIKALWGMNCRLDNSIVPFRSYSDFVGMQVRLADLNTWAIGVVAPMNFHVKWYTGRPRPEEIAWKITTGELTADDGVPTDIVSDVLSMNLTHAAEFTAYPEGSPNHPSWPAMHSAASSASLWLAVILDGVTEEQYCEALRVDYAVSYGRTVAGVHYHSDNIAGLNLGNEIMRRKLADHLHEKYGSNRERVQAKIESLIFDWAKFDPETCIISR